MTERQAQRVAALTDPTTHQLSELLPGDVPDPHAEAPDPRGEPPS
jgi:hypothetical protein